MATKNSTSKKPKAANPKKATKQKTTSFSKKVTSIISRHKLIVFLGFLLLLFPLSWLNSAYKDWDNAQMIKGLAKDFPALVSEIENATGLELVIDVNCMTTTEKYGSGVKLCELSVGSNKKGEYFEKINAALEQNNKLTNKVEFANNAGYSFRYNNKKSCELYSTSSDHFNFNCTIGVRDKNTELAKEAFSKLEN